jgi:hypothetical protein
VPRSTFADGASPGRVDLVVDGGAEPNGANTGQRFTHGLVSLVFELDGAGHNEHSESPANPSA